MTPYEQSQLRVFVEVDIAIKWSWRHKSLEEMLHDYLYNYLCETLGRNETEELYDAGWTSAIEVDGNCFVVELMEARDETQ